MDSKCYLGIDVSKGYADFLLLNGHCKVVEESFQLTDAKDGRHQLSELIESWKLQGVKELYCGVESTGGYENNWHSFLKGFQGQGGVYVCRLNAKGVKSVGDAALKRTITDSVSAENIASYLIKFPDKTDYGLNHVPGNNGFKEGRQHLTCIKMWQKQKVQLGNQLEKLLYQHFSEILIYCRHGTPVWLLNMLVKYPTATLVGKSGVGRLSTMKGIGKEKAKAVIGKAKESNQQISPQIAHLITVTAKEILHKENLIKTEKHYLTTLYKDSQEVTLLKSIPGIGMDSAVAIALEIEDVSRFETAKKLASYFGVHPTFKQSGDGLWGNHMSKKGRGEIRAVLYMASLSAVRYNPVLKEVYARFRAKGMTHSQAAGIVMHKILRMIYGILKNKQLFNAETDEQNQQKATGKQKQQQATTKEEKRLKHQNKYRFQAISIDAPISRRNQQTRKKQIASQTSNEANAG